MQWSILARRIDGMWLSDGLDRGEDTPIVIFPHGIKAPEKVYDN
jgi:hypothetical protein